MLVPGKTKVDLGAFSNRDFDRGASGLKEALWLVVRLVLFLHCPLCLSKLKCYVLRLFGAEVGRHVIIKPQVKITFPWKLTIKDNVWLGEECYILNLAHVTLAHSTCISQRAFLCTGNHDYRKATFDLITKPITIHEGAWIGAGAFVGPGVVVGSHAVLAALSVANKELTSWTIYQGNPALPIGERVITSPTTSFH